MDDLPAYVWALTLIGVLGIPAATCAVLYRGAIVAELGRRTAITVTAVSAAALGGWLGLSAALAYSGAYQQRSGQPVPWLLVVFLAGLAGLLAATRIPVLRRILAHPGTVTRFALPHTLRVVGVLFVIVMAEGQLPAAFALPAGLGDFAIGVTAPFVARRLLAGTGRAAALRFNWLGILDLVVAAAVGYLLFGLVHGVPSTAPLRLLPLALVPAGPVPLALALHVVSLRRLRRPARRSAAAPAGPSVGDRVRA